MTLKDNGIFNVDSWFAESPPMGGQNQWVEGRSAQELARYMTKNYPSIPEEIENLLLNFTSASSEFKWGAEHVTSLPGVGEGRNHDAILFGEDIVITIEAKADEPLGNLIEEEIETASVNKLYRISSLLRYIFKDNFKNYQNLRYQLLTASVGTILEAQKNDFKTAVLIVLIFKSNGNVTEEKLITNHKDIESFLSATKAYKEKDLFVIPNNTNVKLYFKEIII